MSDPTSAGGSPKIAINAVIDLTDNLPPPPDHIESIELAEAEAKNQVPFAEIGLPEEIQRAVDDLGFTHCTPIQAAALPECLKGRDLMGQAQTGTGKTAAFLITAFSKMLRNERVHPTAPRAVVVAPTRELALQIAEDAAGLSRHTDLRTVAVFGGMDWEKQARQLDGTVDLVVGTPGRMMDYMKRGLIQLNNVEVVVIDEADRMFDMGFINDIRWIIGRCAKDRQTLLFSATFPFDVVQLATRFLRNPLDVKITPDRVAATTVEQVLYHVPHFEKLQFCLWLLEEKQPKKALIFINTKRTGEWLAFKLWHNGWNTGYISGDVAQKKRLKLVEEFKSGALELLVATDVAARGLHVDDVDVVVNFDLPDDAADYVHRIGRTGRAGAEGKAIAIADERLVENLPAIERYLGHQIKSIVPDDDNFLIDKSPSFRETVVNKRRKDKRDGGRGGRGGRDGGRGGRDGGRGRKKTSHGTQPQDLGKSAAPSNTAPGEGAPKKKRRRRRKKKPQGEGQQGGGQQSGGQQGGGQQAPAPTAES
ncbi:MAG: DEAD/DEAH box helicase [Myxococcales bacterium]|nr:DEAD/DEAH box helicase [Myxococcales bacterium]